MERTVAVAQLSLVRGWDMWNLAVVTVHCDSSGVYRLKAKLSSHICCRCPEYNWIKITIVPGPPPKKKCRVPEAPTEAQKKLCHSLPRTQACPEGCAQVLPLSRQPPKQFRNRRQVTTCNNHQNIEHVRKKPNHCQTVPPETLYPETGAKNETYQAARRGKKNQNNLYLCVCAWKVAEVVRKKWFIYIHVSRKIAVFAGMLLLHRNRALSWRKDSSLKGLK